VGAIVVGLRPGDHKRLKELAEVQGRPPQELAGIYLERAIRRVRAPAATPATTSATLTSDQREPIGAA
jgi:hypothetical protein